MSRTTKKERFEEENKLSSAVLLFAGAMKLRLNEKMLEGKRGWDDPKWAVLIAQDLRADANQVWTTNENLTQDLLVDIANRAMMLWHQRGGIHGK